MRTILPALLIVLALPAGASAQQLGERLPGQRSETGMPGGKTRTDGLRPCPQQGPGFVKLDGSNTCVKLSGEVQFEYGVGGGRRGYYNGSTGTRTGMAVELDARTETDLGPLRAVIRGGGAVDTGVMRDQPWRRPY